MRCLERNKVDFYYALYHQSVPIKDRQGNETGETRVIYRRPVKARANISPVKGEAQIELFGTALDYDRVITMDDVNTPIDENTMLYVDTLPKRRSRRGPYYGYDYVVTRVARTLNSVSIAISKVETS